MNAGDMVVQEPTFEELIGEDQTQDEELEADAKLKAHDIFLRLQATFPPPSYITMEEVRDATGFDGHRTADAMAISLYRSRGKAIWGFEIKVSRNDWLKELKQPEKAESIMRYCHHWALIVPDLSIVKAGELPSTWGLYLAQKNRLKCVTPAPMLDPLPMSITMLTALLYNLDHSHKMVDKAALDAEYSRGYEQGAKRDYDKSWESNFRSLQEHVHKFEQASGLKIEYGWQSEKIGGMVRLLLDGNAEIDRVLNQSKWGLRQAESNKQALEKQIAILEQVKAGTLKVAEVAE
jgi:hypothetical protein